MIKPPTEAYEARVFMQWCKRQGYRFTHVKNETGRPKAGPRTRNIKAMWDYIDGVRPGFPDFVIIAERKVIIIELKRSKLGKVSQHQLDWIAAFKEAGIDAAVCNGAEAAINFVKAATAR